MAKGTNILEDAVRDILERCGDEIKSNLDAQNITASGRTRDSVQVQEYEIGIRLVSVKSAGGAPFSTTERGRQAGAVPQNFSDILRQWAADKGITFADERDENHFIWGVITNIRNRGYGRPSRSDYGSVSATVYTEPVRRAADEIRKIIGVSVRKMIGLNN